MEHYGYEEMEWNFICDSNIFFYYILLKEIYRKLVRNIPANFNEK